MLSCCIYMSLKCSAMKVKIIILLSLVCVFSADLLGGLENIHLAEEFTSFRVLSRMIKRI